MKILRSVLFCVMLVVWELPGSDSLFTTVSPDEEVNTAPIASGGGDRISIGGDSAAGNRHGDGPGTTVLAFNFPSDDDHRDSYGAGRSFYNNNGGGRGGHFGHHGGYREYNKETYRVYHPPKHQFGHSFFHNIAGNIPQRSKADSEYIETNVFKKYHPNGPSESRTIFRNVNRGQRHQRQRERLARERLQQRRLDEQLRREEEEGHDHDHPHPHPHPQQPSQQQQEQQQQQQQGQQSDNSSEVTDTPAPTVFIFTTVGPSEAPETNATGTTAAPAFTTVGSNQTNNETGAFSTSAPGGEANNSTEAHPEHGGEEGAGGLTTTAQVVNSTSSAGEASPAFTTTESSNVNVTATQQAFTTAGNDTAGNGTILSFTTAPPSNSSGVNQTGEFSTAVPPQDNSNNTGSTQAPFTTSPPENNNNNDTDSNSEVSPSGASLTTAAMPQSNSNETDSNVVSTESPFTTPAHPPSNENVTAAIDDTTGEEEEEFTTLRPTPEFPIVTDTTVELPRGVNDIITESPLFSEQEEEEREEEEKGDHYKNINSNKLRFILRLLHELQYGGYGESHSQGDW